MGRTVYPSGPAHKLLAYLERVLTDLWFDESCQMAVYEKDAFWAKGEFVAAIPQVATRK